MRLRATYRVQLRPEFGFDAAAAIAGYLADLGVSDLYSSPVLQAARGSTHGYDVVDSSRLNAELGGPQGYARLEQALAAAGLGQLLDVVPNHMAVTGGDNAWWWDVLEDGPCSVYAAYFDIDWEPPEPELRNRVLLPILGDRYGRVLEAGELRLAREAGSVVVRYGESRVAPVTLGSLGEVLGATAGWLAGSTGAEGRRSPGPVVEGLAAACGRLASSGATDQQSRLERRRQKEELKARMTELFQAEPGVAAAVDRELAALNSDLERLDALLVGQNYRLAFWKTAGQEINYRRFFDVSSLAGLRVEDDRVFADTHVVVLDLAAVGVVDGMRIDHVDGLRDPAGYLRKLAGLSPRSYLVVEKILEGGEALPESWPVAGTTGYDWLNLCGGLFVDPGGAQPLRAAYAEFTGQDAGWPDVVDAAKRQVMRDALAADVARVVELLVAICQHHRRYRDYTRSELQAAVVSVIAAFPVYRTYVSAGDGASAWDRAWIQAATRAARDRGGALDGELLDFLADLLALGVDGQDEREFVLRFQQLTGPVMAKGVEDTALYRYFPLLSLNEVGGDPVCFGTAPEAFHRACQERQTRQPHSLVATSTHDTKRSEDVRARISLLSELPAEWGAVVARWSAINDRHRRGDWPDRNTEWLMYQTLVGAWPIDVDRLTSYLRKATCEAKTHTSWSDPVAAYDDAVRLFAQDAMADDTFRGEVDDFVATLTRPGWTNSLAQKLLTLTGPGVADVYQGSELWDLSLVDPDNRRAVDFALRRRLLAGLDGASAAAVWSSEDGSGRSKLLVVAGALRLRRDHPEWFGAGPDGAYQPLEAEGPAAEHVVAFGRGAGGVVTIVPRLPVTLERRGGWGHTTVRLPPGIFRSALAGGSRNWQGNVKMVELLADFPVALLHVVAS